MDAFGGGIFNTGTLTVRHSSFVHNQSIGADGTPSSIGSSALGGAIMSSGTPSAPATATVSHSTFLDNQAVGGAAGAGASRAGIGGAIMNATGTFTVSHSVFHDNQAVGGLDNGVPGGFGAGSGGAIANVARFGDAILSVSHSTFLTNNRAVGGAAGTGARRARRPGRRDRELHLRGTRPSRDRDRDRHRRPTARFSATRPSAVPAPRAGTARAAASRT